MKLDSPVFIHSLFRSGSTYVFNVFRTSGKGFWCYQEPLHETVLTHKSNPKRLIEEDDSLLAALRHPDMSAPHFQEIYEVAEICLPNLSANMCYSGYFTENSVNSGAPYLSSLIGSAKGRPLIEECRTASRIGVLKSLLGGTHIYLWRNPWDQWWSYKTLQYFAHANQVILDSSEGPAPIKLLKDAISFVPSGKESITEQFEYFYQRPLPARESYLVFYVLWCIALKEGKTYADILLNIDSLSESVTYRQCILEQLQQHQIFDLDFSDCRSPSTVFDKSEIRFFEEIEMHASEILLAGGWSQADLDEVQSLRKRFAPSSQSESESTDPASALRDASRARQLILRHEDTQSQLSQHLVAKSNESCKLLNDNKNLRQALEKVALAAGLKQELLPQKPEQESLESELQVICKNISDNIETIARQQELIATADHRLEEKNLELTAIHSQLSAMINSISWRITSPLRLSIKALEDLPRINFFGIIKKTKQRIKWYLAKLLKLALQNPELKRKVALRLARNPRLKAKIKRLAWTLERRLRNAPQSQPSSIQDILGSTAAPNYSAAPEIRLARKEAGINQDQKSPLESYFYS